MKLMYLDESGDHNLGVIDPSYPMFVLGGIIVDEGYAQGTMTEELCRFKRDCFGREDLILHTADIARNRKGFECLKDVGIRRRFYDGLNELMRTLDYQVVACAIRKDEHLARYGLDALDPYMFSLKVLVERFCYEVGGRTDGGRIVAEKRDPTLDRQLELAWQDLRNRGTGFLGPKTVCQRISDLECRHKGEDIAGLQLADLVVSPIGRFVLGKEVKEDFRIIEEKFRRREGSYQGAGLVVLPKT